MRDSTNTGVRKHRVSKTRVLMLAVAMALLASFVPMATQTASASGDGPSGPVAAGVAAGDVSNDASPPPDPAATGIAESDVGNQAPWPTQPSATDVADRAITNATKAPQICWDLYGEIAALVTWLVALGDSPWADMQRIWYAQDLETLLNQYDLLNCGDYSDMPNLPTGL